MYASERQYDRERGSAASRGYGRRWKIVRDCYLAQHPFCADPYREHQQPTMATEVDHIEPHRGNTAKFWDFRNLQSLCKSCHSRKTASGG